ncbi:hypothetical protein C8J56DRAFT_837044 [Mycena floridula]|nr:hypothetical protein C8J56DRAFT_837044 [Mycena floridula]
MSRPRRKCFIPLESNPAVFTNLIRNLGVESLEFQDVLSVDDPELLAMVTRPALALIYIGPESDNYTDYLTKDEAERPVYQGQGASDPILFIKQTIGNACGTMAILHSLFNGRARSHILPESVLDRLLRTLEPLGPSERSRILEESSELEQMHSQAAQQGDSEVPSDPEVEAPYHFLSLVPDKDGKIIYEMSGDRKGPVDTGILVGEDGDMLSEGGRKAIRSFLERETGPNQNFNVMALVPTS